MSITPSARSVAIDLIGTDLRRKRPLDDAIEDNVDMAGLAPRDRAFARLLVATVLRRLGQIDALIAHCLNTPLPPRAAIVHDMLRLGDRKSTRLNSSHPSISYAVFCLKKKKILPVPGGSHFICH